VWSSAWTRTGTYSVPFGKLSFSVEITARRTASAIIEAVLHARPVPTAKGVFIKRVHAVSSTMGPGLHVNVRDAAVAA
jgi:ribosomal protein L1